MSTDTPPTDRSCSSIDTPSPVNSQNFHNSNEQTPTNATLTPTESTPISETENSTLNSSSNSIAGLEASTPDISPAISLTCSDTLSSNNDLPKESAFNTRLDEVLEETTSSAGQEEPFAEVQDSEVTSPVGSPEFALAALGALITVEPVTQDSLSTEDVMHPASQEEPMEEATLSADEEDPVVEWWSLRRVTRSMTRLARESTSPTERAGAGSSPGGSTRRRERSASTPASKRTKRSS